ncbi:MAG: VPLPA-CTERM sorting domain-containing protein [Pseudomonadota bacterium]
MSHAVIVAPGASGIVVPQVNGGTQPDLLGGIANADADIPFAIEVGGVEYATGTVRNRIVRSFNLGTLIVRPTIRNLSVNPGATVFIESLTFEGFNGFTTDIFTNTDGLGTFAIDTADRSADGENVTLNFSGFDLSDSTLPLAILTNATDFGPGGEVVLAGTVTPTGSQAQAFTTRITGFDQPINPVPLPASALLLLGGLAALTVARKRR